MRSPCSNFFFSSNNSKFFFLLFPVGPFANTNYFCCSSLVHFQLSQSLKKYKTPNGTKPSVGLAWSELLDGLLAITAFYAHWNMPVHPHVILAFITIAIWGLLIFAWKYLSFPVYHLHYLFNKTWKQQKPSFYCDCDSLEMKSCSPYANRRPQDGYPHQ